MYSITEVSCFCGHDLKVTHCQFLITRSVKYPKGRSIAIVTADSACVSRTAHLPIETKKQITDVMAFICFRFCNAVIILQTYTIFTSHCIPRSY